MKSLFLTLLLSMALGDEIQCQINADCPYPEIRIAIYPPPSPCCAKKVCYEGYDAVNETEACMSTFDSQPELEGDSGCTYTCQIAPAACFSDEDCHNLYNGGNFSDYCCALL
mmetsp:Transcript_18269/g.17399  ORF Transcript_18269/g.17399 Transcript_18269/m.17399 type:complete len:112 (+) Transcript_18269:1-336(+)